MESSSSRSKKNKGKAKHHTKSSHGGHHTSSMRQDEPGESSHQQRRQYVPREGRDFGPYWRETYRPGNDESSVERGRNRRRSEEYEGYNPPGQPPKRAKRPRSRERSWGGPARASLELVQTHDRQAHARNHWRQGREAAMARGEPVASDAGCFSTCVIL